MAVVAPDESPLDFAVLDSDLLSDFAGFSCGDEDWEADLRDFLLNDALRQSDGRFNMTHAFYTQQDEPVGFVSLSNAQVDRSDAGLRRQAPYAVVPALLIGRLAVDRRYQGRSYGRHVLGFVRELAKSLPSGCRILALQVDTRNESAIRFYEREGFSKPPIAVNRGMQWMFYDLGPR